MQLCKPDPEVYVERADDIHIISLRRAEKYETRYYFETIKNHFR